MTGAHDHSREASQKRLAVVLGLTSVYLIAEVIGGLMTHSLALLALARLDAASPELWLVPLGKSREGPDLWTFLAVRVP